MAEVCYNIETSFTYSFNLLLTAQFSRSKEFTFPGRRYKFYVEIEKNYTSCLLLYLVGAHDVNSSPRKFDLNMNLDIMYKGRVIYKLKNFQVFPNRYYLTKLLHSYGEVTFKFEIIQESKLQVYDTYEPQIKVNVKGLPTENAALLNTKKNAEKTAKGNKSVKEAKRNVNDEKGEPQIKDQVKGFPSRNAASLKTCNKSVKEAKRNVNDEKDIALLSDDLKNAFLHEEDSDVILRVGDKSYPAHKVIIRNRSSVFRSMLEHDMTEKREGIVNIDDCDPVIFRDFLFYLYTGKLDNLSTENAFDLYYMSDKYNVCQLKLNCADFLLQNLSMDNVCEVIDLALKHCEHDLFDQAVQFFIENAQDIFITVKWQKFLVTNPTQANELIIKAFKNKSGQ